MSQFVGQNVDGAFDWVKASSQTNTGIASPKPIDWKENIKNILNVISTPVLCKDGTYDNEINSPNASIDNSKTCINNGGRAEVQIPIVVKPSVATKPQNLLAGSNNTLTTEDKIYEMFGIKKTDGTGFGIQSRPLGRLLVAVVLVGGYFTYKKFKK